MAERDDETQAWIDVLYGRALELYQFKGPIHPDLAKATQRLEVSGDPTFAEGIAGLDDFRRQQTARAEQLATQARCDLPLNPPGPGVAQAAEPTHWHAYVESAAHAIAAFLVAGTRSSTAAVKSHVEQGILPGLVEEAVVAARPLSLADESAREEVARCRPMYQSGLEALVRTTAKFGAIGGYEDSWKCARCAAFQMSCAMAVVEYFSPAQSD